jgi:CRP/FNR family transcriptional regulator
MKKYPSIALKVMEELSSRLEKAETLIETINLHSAEQRLAQSILALAGDSTEFELPVTKGDYASQLGMTQETLSRKLSMFQDQGFIELRGQRGIVLRDRKGLSKAG